MFAVFAVTLCYVMLLLNVMDYDLMLLGIWISSDMSFLGVMMQTLRSETSKQYNQYGAEG